MSVSGKPVDQSIKGIKAKVPSKVFLGRISGGDGRVELLPLDLMARTLFATSNFGDALDQIFSAGIGFWLEGYMSAAEYLGEVMFTREVLFSASFTGSQSYATVASTAEAVFKIQHVRDAVFTDIGTITFAAGVNEGVFAGAGATFIAGDRMGLVAPASPDATLDKISGTIIGAIV